MTAKMHVFSVEYAVTFGGYEEVAGNFTLFLEKQDAIAYLKKHFEEVKAEIAEAGEEILFVSSYSAGSASAMIETDCSTYEWGIYEKQIF